MDSAHLLLSSLQQRITISKFYLHIPYELADKDEPEFVSSILSFLNGLQNLSVKVVCLQWLSSQLQQSRAFSANLTRSRSR